eukprot:scaffold14007_cov143-Amphora_coffeaeformis.AAC.2
MKWGAAVTCLVRPFRKNNPQYQLEGHALALFHEAQPRRLCIYTKNGLGLESPASCRPIIFWDVRT